MGLFFSNICYLTKRNSSLFFSTFKTDITKVGSEKLNKQKFGATIRIQESLENTPIRIIIS